MATKINKAMEVNKAMEIQDLLTSFQALLKSGTHSDLIIECQERQFKVHKAIVCPRSTVLAAMMSNDCEETQTAIIELDEEYPEMIEKMIEFLYTLRYDDNRDEQSHDDRHNYNHDPRFEKDFPRNEDAFYDNGFYPPVVKVMKNKVPKPAMTIVRKSNPEPEPEKTPEQTPKHSSKAIEGPLLTNAHLFVLGEFYDIPSLRYYAKCQYEETVERRWDSEFFFKSIDLVYEKCMDTKDTTLKEVMVQTARNNIKVLLGREQFVKLLKTYGRFSYDVLRDCVTEGPGAMECNCYNMPKHVTVKTSCSYCHQNLSTYFMSA